MSASPSQHPRILVTVGRRRDVDAWTAYADAVKRVGGEPIAMSPDAFSDDLDLASYDGLLLTGGVDVDPAHYDEPRDPRTQRPFPERDAAELAVTRRALDLDLPLLAICRGFQLLNVVAGGSLLQHLEAEEPHRPRRAGTSGPWSSGWHHVEVGEGSLLARLSGAASMRVNSRHHQAVTPDRLAPDAVATARTDEGGIEVVEAIEIPGHAFALGVQWHPERAEMQGDPALDAGALRLFAGFLDACRTARVVRPR